MTLDALLHQREVVVCVGPGGVGKTTVSAAIALHQAVRGTRSIVCTIDPAKRLANALGVAALGNAETEISPAALAALPEKPNAVLGAMMLDMKRSWDELIERRAPKAMQRAILDNRFYQSLSTALAGSHEYIAMEKLWELKSQARHPLIVLDTPPAAHALDFLEAPTRVLDFLDNDAARWLLGPALKASRAGFSMLRFSEGTVAKTIAKFTGTETLSDLADFMLAIAGMNDDFRERASQTQKLLRAPQTAFVLVTSPAPSRVDEAIEFDRQLRGHGITPAALVVNRAHEPPPRFEAAGADALEASLAARVRQTLDEAAAEAASDAAGVARLRRACPELPVVLVPQFHADVHDLQSLWETARYLFGAARFAEG